jgi:hypothetical protein
MKALPAVEDVRQKILGRLPALRVSIAGAGHVRLGVRVLGVGRQPRVERPGVELAPDAGP